LNQFMHMNKMEDGYFADNMVIYIGKKIVEKLSYDSIIDVFKIWKNSGQIMYLFLYNQWK